MKETFYNLKMVFKYGKGYNKYFVRFTLATLVGIVFNVIVPIFTAKQIVYLTNNQFEQLIYASIIVFVILFINSIKMAFITHNTARYFRGTTKNIQNELGKEMLKMELSDIDKNPSGAFIQRLTSDTNNISHVVTKGEGFLTNILSKVGIFITIFIINKWVFLYYFIASIVLLIFGILKANKANEKDRVFLKSYDKVTSLTGELVRGSRDIKMLNFEKSFMKKFNTEVDEMSEKMFDFRKTMAIYDFIIFTINDIFVIGVILLLIALIKNNMIETAMAVVLFSYKKEVLENILGSISGLLTLIKEFNLSCERVFEILGNKKYKKEVFGKESIKNIKGNIEFRDVSFSYGSNLVLDKLNLKIKAGSTVGIIGKSGAGKTTIFNLICKLYNTSSGKITLDSKSLDKLDKDSIRGNITIISQNPYIFNMSIKENMQLIKDNVTDEEIKEACRIACLDDFIESLPDKYDTVIGEGGVNLSGGQRQRLAIARAFIQKTKIILFDEATSALDNETQSKIQRAIDNLKGEYTILIIAHRLSTIVNCDKIMIIDNGKMQAEGTHEDLLKSNKEYKKLCKTELVKK